MAITRSTKELSTTAIDCGGTFDVILTLGAQPEITDNPTDIVLILDRSGSMTQSLPALKNAANVFIDIIEESTDGVRDGIIGGGSRIGVVSFSSQATQDTQLITSVAALKASVNALNAGGDTNHADAFTKALALFDPQSANAKVMVMVTDGFTTTGGDANVVASAAKAAGVSIYIIGLSGNGGIDETALRQWASQPDTEFVSIAPSDAQLEEIFGQLAQTIVSPGATNVVINEYLSDCFRILSVSTPSRGTAMLVDENHLQWLIPELGVTQEEEAVLRFTAEHLGACSGLVSVNESIDYDDAQGNTPDFGDPEILVNCGDVVIPEPCPLPVSITMEGCEDEIEIDAGDAVLESLGRILKLDVTIPNVCPGRRVALAVILTEEDDEGNEYRRGMKTLVIPAHDGESCRDVTVRCIRFVLPEELDVSGDAGRLCDQRNFRVRFIANYIDAGFTCCTPDD
ncbi:MAG: VWA domain-containing protein [Oscillospiraceae bacterium]|nr:VWA domain-containing protein [Oscillospiraceae bacterium]